ncbi:MAG: hypothetical protein U0229_06800 [Anaeromyxobacter sp.]
MRVRHPLALSALAVSAAAVLAGCATIFTGTSDVLRFEANVPNVKLTVDGQYLGELPLTVPMSRNFMGGRQFIAKFERAGYQTQEFQLRREFNAVAILDVSSTITSGGIDLITGALMKFSPLDYHVQMVPAGQAGAPEERRKLDAWRFAVMNHRALQRDLARGGGEALDALAAVMAGDDAGARDGIRSKALAATPDLLRTEKPDAFVARLDAALEGDSALSRFRI